MHCSFLYNVICQFLTSVTGYKTSFYIQRLKFVSQHVNITLNSDMLSERCNI